VATKRPSERDSREAMDYVKEVIVANRSLKDWQIRNTYYAIAAQVGIYSFVKVYSWMIVLAILAIAFVTTIAVLHLRDLDADIKKVRERERETMRRLLPVAFSILNGTLWAEDKQVSENESESEYQAKQGSNRHRNLFTALLVGNALLLSLLYLCRAVGLLK